MLEGRIVPVHHDLGDDRGDLFIQGIPPELVDEVLLEHERHAALGHGVADVQGIRRNLVDGFLHLDEKVPHLGAVAVDDDELIALLDDVNHELGRLAGERHLVLLEPVFVVGQEGVSAEGDEGDFSFHQKPFNTSFSVGEPISSSS